MVYRPRLYFKVTHLCTVPACTLGRVANSPGLTRRLQAGASIPIYRWQQMRPGQMHVLKLCVNTVIYGRSKSSNVVDSGTNR